MLPADVYSRVMRLLGHDVTYICATDEHGTPAELAAQAAGVSVQQYCDEQYEIQRAAGEASACPLTGSAAPRARRTMLQPNTSPRNWRSRA